VALDALIHRASGVSRNWEAYSSSNAASAPRRWSVAKGHREAGLAPPGGGAEKFCDSRRTAALPGCGRVEMAFPKLQHSRATGAKADFLRSKTGPVERAMHGGLSQYKNGSRACGAQPTPPTAARQYAPSPRG